VKFPGPTRQDPTFITVRLRDLRLPTADLEVAGATSFVNRRSLALC
jgi:hypothetical protein